MLTVNFSWIMIHFETAESFESCRNYWKIFTQILWAENQFEILSAMSLISHRFTLGITDVVNLEDIHIISALCWKLCLLLNSDKWYGIFNLIFQAWYVDIQI